MNEQQKEELVQQWRDSAAKRREHGEIDEVIRDLRCVAKTGWLCASVGADLIDQLRQRVAEVTAANTANKAGFEEYERRYYLEVNAREDAEAKLALAEQDVAALRGFAQAVMECWPEGDVDGGYLQDMAEKHGLLKTEERTIPCGENCGCAEFYMSGEVATCYRGTPLLRGAAIDASGETRP